jgi:HAE1 family hydrophobic/amphiphilic exporter-1
MTNIGRGALAAVLVVSWNTSPAVAQATQGAGASLAATAGDQVRRLTVDEAVRLAIENNLGLQVARINPQIQDLAIAIARAAWAPTISTTAQGSSTDTPNTSFLSGSQGKKTTNGRLFSTVGLAQPTRWGGSYSVGWDSARSTTTNLFSNFSPQLSSSLSISVRQPLLRNFNIDGMRQQLMTSEKNRDTADIDVRQALATASRSVRDAYWDLAYANASLAVQQQSLDLARESLRETNARIQIGTMPPIDAVAAQAEVALREEAVIVAQAQIDTAQDALRALVFNPSAPDFWTTRIEPTDLPAFQPVTVDVDVAVRNALQMRTDLQQTRTSLDANDISVRYFRNQTLPDVTASFDYGLTGLGGTQFVRGAGFPGPIVGQTERSFASVLGNLFTNQYPNWTLALNVSYPLGHSTQEASLARAQLQSSQGQTQLRNAELQVVTQVRNVARQVLTNQKRVDSTRASRGLAEQRLDAEQKKLAAGTSTSFVVFQAQRDLAQARNNELSAILDYNRSVVDLETIQQAPIAGGTGGVTTVTVTTSASAAASR